MKRLVLPVAAVTVAGALSSCAQIPGINDQNSASQTPPAQKEDTGTKAPDTSSVTPVTNSGTQTAAASTEKKDNDGDEDAKATASSGATATASSDTSKADTAAADTGVLHSDTVSYSNPAGTDEVNFSVTVEDGKIVAVAVVPKAVHDVSKMLQGKFKDAVSSEVVGKAIKDLNLHAVGGASLTTEAFVKFLNSF